MRINLLDLPVEKDTTSVFESCSSYCSILQSTLPAGSLVVFWIFPRLTRHPDSPVYFPLDPIHRAIHPLFFLRPDNWVFFPTKKGWAANSPKNLTLLIGGGVKVTHGGGLVSQCLGSIHSALYLLMLGISTSMFLASFPPSTYLPLPWAANDLQHHVFGFTMIALALSTWIFYFSLLVSTLLDWYWVVFEEKPMGRTSFLE